ncbi:MAG: hypothetical protein ABS36_06120 [Acidobacteria bacterium SCN 69-37]|nr:MAG: hypothetical protein ABS36_06120 [Acidobacteria bacterium SCN 69-37]
MPLVSGQLAALPAGTLEEIEARNALDRQLRAFVDGLKPTITTGAFKLDNSPLTQLTFGIVSSFSVWSRGTDVRAKVSDNKLAADPAPRALQMVVLNWSPWGYQSKSTRRWNKAAFFRPFAGVAFSPDIGLSVGASFMVLSNFGANIGYAHLLITQPAAGLELGTNLAEKLPQEEGGGFRYSDELRRDPLRRGSRHALFMGFSYNFK